MTTDNVRKLVQRAGQEAHFAFSVHLHMLRDASDTSSPTTAMTPQPFTTIWSPKHLEHGALTELSRQRFKDFWKD